MVNFLSIEVLIVVLILIAYILTSHLIIVKKVLIFYEAQFHPRIRSGDHYRTHFGNHHKISKHFNLGHQPI